MKTQRIKINNAPTPKNGPIYDFGDAVKSQEGVIRFGAFYVFGSQLIRFYLRKNQMGADFFKPLNSKGNPNTFRCIRISTTGKRRGMGDYILQFDDNN